MNFAEKLFVYTFEPKNHKKNKKDMEDSQDIIGTTRPESASRKAGRPRRQEPQDETSNKQLQGLKQLGEKYKRLTEQYNELLQQKETLETEKADLDKSLETANATIAVLTDERDKANGEVQHHVAAGVELSANNIIVPCEPCERKLFQYLCEREAKRLGRDDVKPEHILQFLFREELVKGTNRPIKSIPDSVIREVEKEFGVKIL